MPKYATQSNVSIFNAVRAVMSEDFKARIPEATKENMIEVIVDCSAFIRSNRSVIYRCI